MKRSLRVSTVFTGAVACAAAMTPAAHAAVVAPGATGRVTPDIGASPCPNGDLLGNVLVLHYTPSEHHGPECFGGSGRWYVGAGVRFASYCATSKSGSLLVDGRWQRFGPGLHHLYGQSVTSIYMNSNSADVGICYG
jgi:hypothetical protein